MQASLKRNFSSIAEDRIAYRLADSIVNTGSANLRYMYLRIIVILVGAVLTPSFTIAQPSGEDPVAAAAHYFSTSDQCIACHSNLHSADGSDVSIGYNWRASMMANSARDPYWHAAVRREVTDHPSARAEIENECSTCHMPMAHFTAETAGRDASVFANLGSRPSERNVYALDGVSCTVCHQIRDDNFGDESSFTGGFSIGTEPTGEQRPVYGPHDVDAGRRVLMQSAARHSPESSEHLRRSELCATCHTLYTHSLDESGEQIGRLPEQVPYLEWLESDFADSQSCQDCHMPELERETAVTSVLGEPRPRFSQHVFRGGNAFMLGILNAHRGELGVEALPQELDATIRRTEQFLGTHTARIEIGSVERTTAGISFAIDVRNLAGHKLPTAYPSRRVWLHVTVRDDERVLFESGALEPDASIAGNDNDADATAYEPHYEQIESSDQVQIYEPILADSQGRVTTGLLTAVRYAKDSRLLPEGFDKSAVPEDVGVFGRALEDSDFTAGADRVRYRLELEPVEGPLTLTAELLYQSIGFRWKQNLTQYDSFETNRFVDYYEEAAADSAVRLANTEVVIER